MVIFHSDAKQPDSMFENCFTFYIAMRCDDAWILMSSRMLRILICLGLRMWNRYYLVGGLDHFLFFHIVGIIIPID